MGSYGIENAFGLPEQVSSYIYIFFNHTLHLFKLFYILAIVPVNKY